MYRHAGFGPYLNSLNLVAILEDVFLGRVAMKIKVKKEGLLLLLD
jgi:hypothetical protein